MLWKVLYQRLPIDKDIQIRDFSLCSMWSLCRKQEESLFHLSFDCSVTSQIWNYTKQVFLEFSHISINDIIDFLMLAGSPLVNIVRLATITYSIWMIWRMRNHVRFHENISICSTIQTIKDFIKMTGNSSRKHMCNDIVHFSYLKFFYITTCSRKEISPIQVICEFSHINWVKINTDGADRGCLGFSTCVGIFCGSRGEYIGSFSSFLRVQKSLCAEVMGVILAIELAWSKDFRRIWLVCDSSLLCQSFCLFNHIP